MKKIFISLALIFCAWSPGINAASLPGNALLVVKPGSGSGLNVRCTAGSCIGTLIAPGLILWQDIYPGTDGGLVIGKQQSFIQDALFNSYCQLGYSTNSSTGQTSCLVTAPSAGSNIFDDVNCSGAGCVGKTEVKSLSINGTDGISGICPPGTSCPGVTSWLLGRPPFQTFPPPYYYVLDYEWVVNSGAFVGAKIYLHLAGDIVYRSLDPIARIVPETVTVFSGDAVNLDGGFSYDPDLYGSIACHSWSIPGIILPAVCTSTISFIAPDVTATTSLPVTLTVTDMSGAQASTTATVTVMPATSCVNTYPITRFTTDGGGGSTAVNNTLTATFTGHIVSSTKSRLIVCRDSMVDYEVASTVSPAHCLLNGNYAPLVGKLRANSKLVCSNLPVGEDTDKYSIIAY